MKNIIASNINNALVFTRRMSSNFVFLGFTNNITNSNISCLAINFRLVDVNKNTTVCPYNITDFTQITPDNYVLDISNITKLVNLISSQKNSLSYIEVEVLNNSSNSNMFNIELILI